MKILTNFSLFLFENTNKAAANKKFFPLHHSFFQIVLFAVNDLKTDRPTSVLSAIFIICNTCLGAATLSMPFTFHQAGGVYASMAVMTISAVLMAVTLVIFGLVDEPNIQRCQSTQESVNATFIQKSFQKSLNKPRTVQVTIPHKAQYFLRGAQWPLISET